MGWLVIFRAGIRWHCPKGSAVFWWWLEELKRMTTLGFNCGNLGALDGQAVDHWWTFRTSYFELKQSNVPYHAVMWSDWLAGLLHAHMKFNYRHHRLQVAARSFVVCNVMHFHRLNPGALCCWEHLVWKSQRFLTSLQEVTATFVFWSGSLATHESRSTAIIFASSVEHSINWSATRSFLWWFFNGSCSSAASECLRK